VKRFLPLGEDPIGKVIDSDDKMTIIGVVRNIRQAIEQLEMAENDFPITQIPAEMRLQVIQSLMLVVRTAAKPEAIAQDLRRAFHELDPMLPFRTPESMKTIVDEALTFERLENWLLGTFATLAVLLALVGLYGLISY